MFFFLDEKFFDLLCLIHAMFPPTQRKAYATDKKNFYKPSIEKSIEGFVGVVENAEDIRGKLVELEKENQKVGLCVQYNSGFGLLLQIIFRIQCRFPI